MASKTKRTEYIRKRKVATSGKARKRINRGAGTTKSQKELFGDK